MGNKIFVSYKYADSSVKQLQGYNRGTVRDYVSYLQDHKFSGDDLNKAESDNEDLSNFKVETIRSKLKDKIWDSSITIVLISPNMVDWTKDQKEQWIPWEIAYSLRTQTRIDIPSKPNALIACVLPNVENDYKYFVDNWYYYDDNNKRQIVKSIRTWATFDILGNNMFNKINPDKRMINGKEVYFGKSSYVLVVKWDDFIDETDKYLKEALELRNSIYDYKICKRIIKEND